MDFAEILTPYYLWLKVFHLFFMVAWMAGIFYLPRLFVYHTKLEPGEKAYDMFLTMERRLLTIIMRPALLLTFFFGGLLALIPGVVEMKSGWFHGKLLLAILMAAYHMWMASHHTRRFKNREREPASETFYRAINEVPSVLLLGILIFVIIRPF